MGSQLISRASIWAKWRACAWVLLPVVLAAGPALAQQAKTVHDPLFGLFPDSGAPSIGLERSEFEVFRDYRPWERNSHWNPEVDEKDVFLVRLMHKSAAERCWDIGIGKGGQIYSMVSSFGEAIPPQTPIARWVDETWQMTTIYERLLGRDLPPAMQSMGNSYVHQSGMYTPTKEMRPFYSPLLAQETDPARRAYSVLNWGQVPEPSVNRSGVLYYTRYRDLGDGAIEVTYVVYNFEPEPLTNISPWGGVRTSVFPEQVLSNPDGSYRFWTPFSYGSRDCYVDMEKTGGWAAMTQNAADPHSFAIALVFGRNLDKHGEHWGKPRYDSGNSRHGPRDYTVQATSVLIKDRPGTAHLLRMYFVIGTLEQVAARANRLVPYTLYEPMDLTPQNTPLVPLFTRKAGSGSDVLTRVRPDAGAQPACLVYAYPVRGSRPLFAIRDADGDRSFVSTDPYARCAREPFLNPLKPGDPAFAKYEHRTLYKAYLRRTTWVELLGYARTECGAGEIPLADVPAASACFDPGECSKADGLFVRPAR
jgi:hypothetical protein